MNRIIVITYKSYLKKAISAEPAEEAIDFIIANFDYIEDLEIVEFESKKPNKKVVGYKLQYLDLIEKISGGTNE
tara:strand:+ start:50 stop:271 length:222 start_codon:yes stop_codon:yes gene_type:complete